MSACQSSNVSRLENINSRCIKHNVNQQRITSYLIVHFSDSIIRIMLYVIENFFFIEILNETKWLALE